MVENRVSKRYLQCILKSLCIVWCQVQVYELKKNPLCTHKKEFTAGIFVVKGVFLTSGR
jgi:hypothetical protein